MIKNLILFPHHYGQKLKGVSQAPSKIFDKLKK